MVQKILIQKNFEVEKKENSQFLFSFFFQFLSRLEYHTKIKLRILAILFFFSSEFTRFSTIGWGRFRRTTTRGKSYARLAPKIRCTFSPQFVQTIWKSWISRREQLNFWRQKWRMFWTFGCQWSRKNNFFQVKKNFPLPEVATRTVFENHRKSLIQHCERSELRLHFEWTKVN